MKSEQTRVILCDYIMNAGEEEVQALATLLLAAKAAGDFDEPGIYDKGFLAALDEEAKDYESGKDPGVDWKDLKEELLSRYTHRKAS